MTFMPMNPMAICQSWVWELLIYY